MNSLINRLFTKDEPTNLEVADDGRHSLLKFLIDQGSNTTVLNQLNERVSNFEFPQNEFLADLNFVQLYLELEEYLIFRDPRYISSEKGLRELIKTEYPKLTQNDSFNPLFHSEKNQEIIIAHHFLNYIVQSFRAEHKSEKLALRWSATLKYINVPVTNLSLVEQINTLSKIKNTSHAIYDEFVKSFGIEWVDAIYNNCYEEFTTIYKRLKSIKSINDLLPNSPTRSHDFPEKNVIQLNGTKVNNRAIPTIEIDKKAILENILDGFIMFDKYARIIEFNRNALDILRIREEDLKKLTFLDFLPEELSEELKKDLKKTDKAIPNNIIGKRFETVLKKRKGDEDHFEISFTNNYTEGEDTYSVFLKNITNKKDSLKAISEAKVNAEIIKLLNFILNQKIINQFLTKTIFS